jgi:hypothetical protein
MTLDRTHLRTLERYRLMFTTSVGTASIGAVLSVIGLVAWAIGPMPVYLPFALFFLSAGGLLSYKFVLSTSRLLETNGGYKLD